MKIVQILPGSGGTFYCENCLRDSALAQELRRQGHDVILVPMYLPLYTDVPDLVSEAPVFFGGINVYLQQKLRLFRKTPRWLDRLFDARWILKLAAKQAGATDAAGMGPMTISMIRGEEGHQAKELDRMVEWLKNEGRPDIVHISSILLIGLARQLKKELSVPVICSTQDEQQWIDAIAGDWPEQCWNAIREKLSDVDGLITVSKWYRDIITAKLQIDSAKVKVVPVGMDIHGYQLSELPLNPPVAGFLTKITPSLGFETFIDACIMLKKTEEYRNLQIRALGGIVGKDRAFADKMINKLAAEGMEGDAVFYDDLERGARQKFISQLTVMSVPMPHGEAFGTFILEAWAAGVPVVQPRAGGFPELVEPAQGGIIYDDNSAKGLAAAIRKLLSEPEALKKAGAAGRAAVTTSFNVEIMANNMIETYKQITGDII